LQELTLAEKMQRWKNFKLTARILANPMATFAAAGLAFAAAGADGLLMFVGLQHSLLQGAT
jgi:hypothetical protein